MKNSCSISSKQYEGETHLENWGVSGSIKILKISENMGLEVVDSMLPYFDTYLCSENSPKFCDQYIPILLWIRLSMCLQFVYSKFGDQTENWHMGTFNLLGICTNVNYPWKFSPGFITIKHVFFYRFFRTESIDNKESLCVFPKICCYIFRTHKYYIMDLIINLRFHIAFKCIECPRS
jgi:hypothetical protein